MAFVSESKLTNCVESWNDWMDVFSQELLCTAFCKKTPIMLTNFDMLTGNADKPGRTELPEQLRRSITVYRQCQYLVLCSHHLSCKKHFT